MINSVSEIADPPPPLKPAPRLKSPPAQAATTVDRLPPHSPEAEQGVLACVLLSPNDCMGETIQKLKGGAEVFYDLRHQVIFTALEEMYDHREPIDTITLQAHLKNKQMLDQAGGLPYLAALPDLAPSAANLSYYLEIVHEKYLLRKMIRTCTEIVGRLYDYEGEVDAVMDQVESEIFRISEARVQVNTLTIKDLVKQAINTIEDFHARKGELTGLATGFTDFDKMTSGLHAGEMIVIAARPSLGKTSLAMNIADFVSVDKKLPVGVFS